MVTLVNMFKIRVAIKRSLVSEHHLASAAFAFLLCLAFYQGLGVRNNAHQDLFSLYYHVSNHGSGALQTRCQIRITPAADAAASTQLDHQLHGQDLVVLSAPK